MSDSGGSVEDGIAAMALTGFGASGGVDDTAWPAPISPGATAGAPWSARAVASVPLANAGRRWEAEGDLPLPSAADQDLAEAEAVGARGSTDADATRSLAAARGLGGDDVVGRACSGVEVAGEFGAGGEALVGAWGVGLGGRRQGGPAPRSAEVKPPLRESEPNGSLDSSDSCGRGGGEPPLPPLVAAALRRPSSEGFRGRSHAARDAEPAAATPAPCRPQPSARRRAKEAFRKAPDRRGFFISSLRAQVGEAVGGTRHIISIKNMMCYPISDGGLCFFRIDENQRFVEPNNEEM
jgi:hypothetical protein